MKNIAHYGRMASPLGDYFTPISVLL